MIQRPGLIRIGFDDLLAALRSQNGRCLFGFGESDSDNRAHDALTQALKNPLMDRGRMLADAAHVLVQVAGGPGMTLSEVEILMQELGRHVSDQTQILFGTAVDGRMGNRLSVTIISSLSAEGTVQVAPMRTVKKPEPPVVEPEPTFEAEPERVPIATEYQLRCRNRSRRFTRNRNPNRSQRKKVSGQPVSEGRNRRRWRRLLRRREALAKNQKSP